MIAVDFNKAARGIAPGIDGASIKLSVRPVRLKKRIPEQNR